MINTFTSNNHYLLPRYDGMGDVILLSGFLHALRAAISDNARITMHVRKPLAALKELFPETIEWKTTEVHPYAQRPEADVVKELAESFREIGADCVLSTTHNARWLDRVAAAALRSAKRVALGEARELATDVQYAFKNAGLPDNGPYFEHRVSASEWSHETEKYASLWKSLGFTGELPPPRLTVPDKWNSRAEKILSQEELDPGAFIVCAPAGHENVRIKNWGPKRYGRLLARAAKESHVRSLLVGHESEAEILYAVQNEARAHGGAPVLFLGNAANLPLTAALISAAGWYCGNDTGLMHMASALGKPVAAVFGGGTWPRFTPTGDYALALRTLPCFGCYWECHFASGPCIQLVDEETAWSALSKVLNNTTGFQERFEAPTLFDTYLSDVAAAVKKGDQAKVVHLQERQEALNTWQLGLRQFSDSLDKRANHVHEFERRMKAAMRKPSILVGFPEDSQDYPDHGPPPVTFSIVTPSFKRWSYLDNCIESVLTQEGNFAIEYVVQDGDSPRQVIDVLDRWRIACDTGAFKPKCKGGISYTVTTEPDNGMYDALNRGFAKTSGEIMAWLNTDDLYHPGAFETVRQIFQRFPDVGWITGIPNSFNQYGARTGLDSFPSAYSREYIRRGWYDARFIRYGFNWIPQDCCFWRRSLWEKAGGYLDENKRYAADFDLWQRFAAHTDLVKVYVLLGGFRCHGDQLTAEPGQYDAELPQRKKPPKTLGALNIACKMLPPFRRFVFRGGKLTFPIRLIGLRRGHLTGRTIHWSYQTNSWVMQWRPVL